MRRCGDERYALVKSGADRLRTRLHSCRQVWPAAFRSGLLLSQEKDRTARHRHVIPPPIPPSMFASLRKRRCEAARYASSDHGNSLTDPMTFKVSTVLRAIIARVRQGREKYQRLSAIMPEWNDRAVLSIWIMNHIVLRKRGRSDKTGSFRIAFGDRSARVHIRDTGNDFYLLDEVLGMAEYGLAEAAIKHSSVIYDIGANIGLVSLYMKLINPNAQVYAFEPGPSETRLCAKNLAQMDSTAVFAVALGRENAVAQLNTDPFRAGGQALVSVDGKTWGKQIEVPVFRMASLIEKHNLPLPDLVKIDVEGAEESVLLGFAEVLAHVRIAVLEYHSHELRRRCIEILTDAGLSKIDLIAKENDAFGIMVARRVK